MSMVYDNWERLFEAVRKREAFKELAYSESFSSISTDFSSHFSFDSTFEDFCSGPQHQLEPHNGTKTITEKDVELQKEKPRASTNSSTFSSRGCNRTNISECPFHSSTNDLQSPDIQDVVEDSMQRETCVLSIKSSVSDARKVTVMKRINSPQPLQQLTTLVYEGSPRGSCRVQEGTRRFGNERMTHPRYSYDGRELRDAYKTTIKIQKLPRSSLDSKTSSMKCSDLESRLNFRNENSSQVVPLNQELGSHSRSNSIVAKLLGLDDFPDTDECTIMKIKSSRSPSPQAAVSSPVLQENPASSSTSMHNAYSLRKSTTCSRLPMELATWKQRDPQGSPKMAAQLEKAPVNNIPHSSSVYCEIERRLTALEFKGSGKDLITLKHILEAMMKTSERIENQIEEPAEVTLQKSCPDPNPNLSMWQNRKTYQHVQTVEGTSGGIRKSAKVMEKVKTSSSHQAVTMDIPYLPRIKIRETRYHMENQACRGKAKDITPRNDMKRPNRCVPGYKHNHTLEKILHIHEPRLLKTELNEIAANQKESVYQSVNPDCKYITKMPLASWLLKDTDIIPTADQLLSSCHLMNSNMFHALEEMEDSTD